MLPCLFDPDLKLQWAKVRLDELATEAAIIEKLNRPKLTTENDLEHSQYIFRFQDMHDMRAFQAALRAGDFIANLRASLDHLAWQLALLGGNMPNNKICFPICEINDSDAKRFIKKSMEGVPCSAVKVIESFQPYQAGKNFRDTHLWRLNKLWNIDKHRHLTPHSILPEWQFCTHGVAQIAKKEVDNGVEFSVPLADKDKIEFNLNCSVQFTVRDSAEGIDLTINDLIRMYEFVADTIFPSFAGFFSQPVTVGKTI
jgi:hypothetical protein